MDKNLKTTIIIGFALFASFFGAGNLIFPPSIGIAAGDQWPVAMIAFIIAGIILPICSFIVVSRGDGTEEGIAKELGGTVSKVIIALLMVCGSLIIVVPRTAAVTYEIGVTTFIPDFPKVLTSVIFFAIVFLFSVNKSSVMDKVGKFLTPVLLAAMAIIVIKGILAPIAEPVDLGVSSVFASSFIGAYQTLDAIGAIAFSGAIMATIIGKGYTDKKSQRKVALQCAIVAGIGLLFIYGGLCYVGATGSGKYPADMDTTQLLLNLINDLMGHTGMQILAIAVAFACLTTAIGALLFGGGMFFSGFARNVAMLLASYGLGCGLGMGMIYGCTVSNSVKFFPDKKGLVGGIATASYGISSVLVPPIARILIQSCGILATFRIFGAISFAIIAAGSFVIIQCPADFRPTGWVEPRKVQTAERKEYSWKEMLRTPRFYFMMLIMMCGAISGMMCISQASGIAQKLVGLSASAATGAVSILALFNTGGRIAAGKISDKLGRTKTLGIGLALSLIGLLMLYCTGTSEVLKFYAGISFIGISFGTIMGIYPAFTAEQFGMKNNSVNYGIMFIGFAFAGYIGPMVMKKMYTVQGIYNNAFLFAAGLTACGAVLLFVLKKIDQKFD